MTLTSNRKFEACCDQRHRSLIIITDPSAVCNEEKCWSQSVEKTEAEVVRMTLSKAPDIDANNECQGLKEDIYV